VLQAKSLRNAWMKPNGAGVCFIDFYKETKKLFIKMLLSKRLKDIFRDIFMMCYHMYLMRFVYVMHKSCVTVHNL